MLYLPVDRSWLFSQTAQRVYFGSALLSIALVGTLIGVHSAMSAARAAAVTPLAASVVKILLYPETLGAAILWVGMWYFWFSFDRSHYLKRAIWFCLLFFFAPFGPLFYYFIVYRRNMRQQSEAPPSAMTVNL